MRIGIAVSLARFAFPIFPAVDGRSLWRKELSISRRSAHAMLRIEIGTRLQAAMSAMANSRREQMQQYSVQKLGLLDHVVGECEQRGGNGNAQQPCLYHLGFLLFGAR